ncbi:MAG: response regulator, partial [Candidatus Omnitrophica bacterium]|nr:response regulator [Candidatus Omnitrophota bacterium]
GKRAMEFLEAREYDCVFLDCNMPEVTGLEVAKYLSIRKPRPKIVMMTGYDPMTKEFAGVEGVDVYLKKPIALNEVKTLIEQIGYD